MEHTISEFIFEKNIFKMGNNSLMEHTISEFIFEKNISKMGYSRNVLKAYSKNKNHLQS